MKELSLSELNFDWGGTFAPKYDGYMSTAGVGAPPAASLPSPSPASIPASAPALPSSGAPPAASPSATPGAQPASPAAGVPTIPPTSSADPNAPNLEVIRKSHELVQRLGGPDKVGPAVERYNKMYETSRDLATQLGYTPESFEEAFGMDPAGMYNFFVQEAQKVADQRRASDGQIDPKLRDLLTRELSPLRSVLQRQMADTGNRLTDTEFNSQLSSHTLFKDKQVPAEIRSAIYDRFVDLASTDVKTQQAILNNGDVSGLKTHFDKAVADYFAAVNAYNAWTAGRGPRPDGDGGNRSNATAPAAAAPVAGANPFNLDDIIEGTENATKGMPSLRNFR